jgi:putative membrane protein insertion efficiency factor
VIGLRRAFWIAGAPVRGALLGVIGLYRATLSGAFAGQCRFSPGCSRYAAEAIRTRGAVVGSALAVRRVLRCNPFGKGGLDPVPPRSASHPAYDVIVQKVTPGR